MGTLIVTEAELRHCLPMDKGSLRATERSFSWISEGRVSMPPVMHIDIDEESAVDTKGAFVAGVAHLAVKIATGFFRNPQIRLPSCSSIIALMNAKTGAFDCIFLDNGYLMNLRTGLAGAVAAKHLAPKTVTTVGVVGTGVQARYQIESLALVREFDRVLVFGRNRASVARYCTDMSQKLGIVVDPCTSLAELVSSAQVVVTTTPATQPIIMAAWLHSDLHITAMGSDLPGKHELHPDVLERADFLACDVFDQCVIGGELQNLGEGGRQVFELGAIISGPEQFSRPTGAVTICDLTGTGAQDTAIAVEAFEGVKAAKLGTLL